MLCCYTFCPFLMFLHNFLHFFQKITISRFFGQTIFLSSNVSMFFSTFPCIPWLSLGSGGSGMEHWSMVGGSIIVELPTAVIHLPRCGLVWSRCCVPFVFFPCLAVVLCSLPCVTHVWFPTAGFVKVVMDEPTRQRPSPLPAGAVNREPARLVLCASHDSRKSGILSLSLPAVSQQSVAPETLVDLRSQGSVCARFCGLFVLATFLGVVHRTNFVQACGKCEKSAK